MTGSSHRLPVLGLVVMVALLFWRAIFGNGVFFQRDIHWVWYPRVESMVRAVAEGAWPLWDPHSAFGLPALADPSYQIAYPLTWLNLVFLPSTYYKVYAIVHALGAGLGLYLLARQRGLSPPSAFVAGAAWTASGPLLSTVMTLHHFAGLAWIPWVLLALDVALARGTAGSSLMLGSAAASQVLAGSGDMCLMTAIAGAAWIAVFVLSRPGARRGALASISRTCGAAALFGLALSAVQWLPTAAILPAGSRLALDPATNTYWSLHPASLPDLLVPMLVTDLPMSDRARAVLFESREPFLWCLYLGVGISLLSGLGLLLGDLRTRALAALCCLFFLLCALGRYTPFYPLLLGIKPFGMLRYPVKYVVPVSLFWALLAGLGMEAWLAPWSRRDGLRAALVAAAALAFGVSAIALGEWVRLRPGELEVFLQEGATLAPAVLRLRRAACVGVIAGGLLWMRRRSVRPPLRLTIALVVVALGDLVVTGRGVNALAPPELAAYRPGWIAALGAHPSPRRLWVALPSPWRFKAEEAREGRKSWTLGVQDMLAPPIGGRWGLDGSYDGDFTGLAPPMLPSLSQLLIGAKGTPLALRLLQIGSVDHVVALEDQAWPEVTRAPSVFSAPIRVYRVPDPLPRAYVVDGAREAVEPQSYAMLQDPAFDPRREAILASGGSHPPRPGFSGTSRLLWRRADALALEADLNGPGYLVVVEGFHSGWRARVDGVPAEVLRANILFRAVPLPAGHHVVELRYRPSSALWGGLLSSCAALFGLAVGARRHTRHVPRTSPEVDRLDGRR